MTQSTKARIWDCRTIFPIPGDVCYLHTLPFFCEYWVIGHLNLFRVNFGFRISARYLSLASIGSLSI